MHCTKCGAFVEDDDKFCLNCGSPVVFGSSADSAPTVPFDPVSAPSDSALPGAYVPSGATKQSGSQTVTLFGKQIGVMVLVAAAIVLVLVVGVVSFVLGSGVLSSKQKEETSVAPPVVQEQPAPPVVQQEKDTSDEDAPSSADSDKNAIDNSNNNAAAHQPTPEQEAENQRREDEAAIEASLRGYLEGFAPATSYNDFSYISPYIDPSSPLWGEQQSFIANVAAAERFYSYEILSFSHSSANTCTVVVNEAYEVNNYNEPSHVRHYENTYTLVKGESGWLMYSLDNLILVSKG
jgi:hypothetical protein